MTVEYVTRSRYTVNRSLSQGCATGVTAGDPDGLVVIVGPAWRALKPGPSSAHCTWFQAGRPGYCLTLVMSGSIGTGSRAGGSSWRVTRYFFCHSSFVSSGGTSTT